MKIFFLLFLLTSTLSLNAQSDVELQIQLITPDIIAEATLDQEPFFDWIKTINDEVETFLKKEKGDKEVIVMITLHKEKDASIKIGSRPEMSGASLEKLAKKIESVKSPRTKIVDYSLAIMANVNDGCKSDMDFVPKVLAPDEESFSTFHELGLKGKKVAIEQWVQTEIIPVLAHFESIVDPQFAGVLAMGEVLNGDFLKKEVVTLTDDNPSYWRAMAEMSIGNQLIPFTKACLHVANGEFDKANRLLTVIELFSDEKSLPAVYQKELMTKLDLFSRDLSKEIEKGIEMHDKGKYDDAVKHYKKLLKIVPNSAWLNYELYFSQTGDLASMDLEDGNKLWNESKKKIYECDPLYSISARATNGKEAYEIVLRQKVQGLFKSNENMKADLIKYADIALDLEDYAFAGQMYWWIVSHLKQEDYAERNMLAHFLYCLDKLGETELKKNFNEGITDEFPKIEAERKSIMEENFMYKAFSK